MKELKNICVRRMDFKHYGGKDGGLLIENIKPALAIINIVSKLIKVIDIYAFVIWNNSIYSSLISLYNNLSSCD